MAGGVQSFSYTGGTRPLPLRLANAAGGLLGGSNRRLIPLSPDRLMRAAERRTGLRDWGDESFREPLEQLLDAIDREARLHTVGRWAVRDETVELLGKRLRIRDYRKRHPEVREVPVERPVFIVGFPRTGSTFLHNLMALDPANRVPRLWELLDPVPPDEPGAGEDPRVEQARRYIRTIRYLSPVALKIHPMGAEDPDECRILLESGFVGPQYLLYYRVPGYFEWFRSLPDERIEAVFLEMRGQIQLLTRGDAGRRWVGKNPSHSFFGRGLVRAFPDACIVHLHRDPTEAVPSICSLAAAYRSIYSDHVDLGALGQESLQLFSFAMDRMMQMREVPGPSFCDVHYRDLVVDPIGAVRRIYAHAGMHFSGELEARIEQYAGRNPQHRDGVHRYSPEQYSLSREAIRKGAERYAGWLEQISH